MWSYSPFLFIVSLFPFLPVGVYSQEKPGQPVQPPPPARLEPGRPVQRVFCIGDSHSYQIELEANAYARVLIEPKGVDVSEILLDPAGKKIEEVDLQEFGSEQVSLLADGAGIYTLQVRSRDSPHPWDKRETCGNGYEISLVDIRAATPQDRIRIKAQALFAQAQQPGPRLERIEKLRLARELWRSVGEHSLEASALYLMGSEYQIAAQWLEVVKCYEEALPIWRSLNERGGEALLLSRLGNAYRILGENQKAIDLSEIALAKWEGLQHPNGQIQVLGDIARLYQSLGDARKAQEYYRRAESAPLPSGYEVPAQVLLLRKAALHDSRGEKEIARDSRLQAIEQIKADGRLNEIQKFESLAAVYFALGEGDVGAGYIERNASHFRAQKDLNNEAGQLSNIATAYVRAGNHVRALDYFERALLIRRTIGGVPLNRFHLLEQIGISYAATGDPRKALDYFREAAEVQGVSNTPSRKASLKYSIALALRDLGNLEEALVHADEMLMTLESRRSKITSEELRRSYFARAIKSYRFYIDLLMLLDTKNASAGYGAKALQTSELSRARTLLESFTEARSDIRQGIDIELLRREKVAQLNLNNAADRHARLLGINHTPEQAAEAGKLVAAATSELDEIAKQIRVSSPRYASLTQPRAMTVAEIQRDLLDPDTILLEYVYGDERSYFWSVTRDGFKGYQLPKSADIETAAINMHTLLQNGKRWSDDGRIRGEYAEAAQKLSDMVLGPVAEQIKGKRLVIVADGALQYVPFSALPSPKSKVQGPKSRVKNQGPTVPLAVTNEIVSLPSASVLSVQRKEAAGRKQKSEGIAVIADPVFSGTDERLANDGLSPKPAEIKTDLSRMTLERAFSFNSEENKPFEVPRLPFTRFEANSIFASAPKKTSIKALDLDADRENVLKTDLSKYRIIHFATHGILHSEHPELSGIVLSLVNEKGEPVNGFLRLNEIYNMNLNADLVVLSACQTALGKEVRGEGLIGLTRGFMYAGSPRVVASLWKVDDVATAELMKIFYQKMLKEKMRPAAALRAAKIAMMKQKRWAAPYYWAAFELQGEWR